ncbi:autotransporter outer membrane beta-barrel domain-containing protein [Pseudomonas sp. LPB0260]|uniref:autotransporter family protein n=1 Tax=Pseudomonas sp. LPB0260 TaxID=2614442 RepID=UPI0015C25C27|nr:autotransporter outer membrane beta-barrel domain-containing protein [Pseudomonas sp. LPB0260]QLC73130.1 autotransporter outer membrane beta-barrel domain-containing protein [Pseudomonas sp. LPB0260]QLC75904.1 autotransporter outer membrane beta-barrel domain-containing protein [Pseudomonas sp. LPB0260]
MPSVSFCKTLLALAVTGAVTPALAISLSLTNLGIELNEDSFNESVEVIGAFTSSNSDQDAIELNSIDIDGDLILNATIDAYGDNAGGLGLGLTNDATPVPYISGSLINKGSISVTGGGAAAMLLDPANIEGNLVNQGILSATGGVHWGEGVRALEFSGMSQISGNLINTASGKILAEGQKAKGMLLMGSDLEGKLINHGLIQAIGEDARAIDVTATESATLVMPFFMGEIENSGRIIALGKNSIGLLLDGMTYDSNEQTHVSNTGSIEGQGAAIQIGTFSIEGGTARSPLRIANSGVMSSQSRAIDASEASGPVYLTATGGSITGNLIDLSNIEIYGNVTFTGSDSEDAHIRMKDMAHSGWIDVGSTSDKRVGHFELGLPHTRLDGNIYVAGNSSLGLNLSRTTDPSKAILDVAGTAEFAQGALIKLAAQGSDFSAQAKEYKLIKAGALEHNGLSVTSSSAFLNVDSFVAQGNEVTAKVSTKSSVQVAEAIRQTGATGNAQVATASFVTGMNQLALSNPNDPVLQAFIAAGNDPVKLAKLAEQLQPQNTAGAVQAAAGSQNKVAGATGARSSSTRGMASGDAFKETGVWLQGLHSEANQDLRDGVAGYTARTDGVIVGADGKIDDRTTLGVAYSYLDSRVNGDNGNTTQVDSHAITLYGGYSEGNVFVDASVTAGFNDNASKRQIATTVAKGNYDTNLLGLNLMAGYAYPLSSALLVEPRLAARFSQIKIDGYSESGSSAALKVDGQTHEAAELGAGVRLAGNMDAGQGTLVPEIRLMAYHDFGADKSESTSSFVLGGTPFSTSGARPARDSYEVGIGADYSLGALTVGASYDRLEKSDYASDTFTAKVRYNF